MRLVDYRDIPIGAQFKAVYNPNEKPIIHETVYMKTLTGAIDIDSGNVFYPAKFIYCKFLVV